MNLDRGEIEGLLQASLAERPLLTFPDVNWRPHFGSEEENIALHVEETEDLGNSIRRRIRAAFTTGTRVYVLLPQGPMSLTIESQEFLLTAPVGIVAAATDEDDQFALHRDFAKTIEQHGTLLDPQLASSVVSDYLGGALSKTGDDRGRALESSLAFAMSQVPGWRVKAVNYRTEMEELDVVVANNSAKSPWNGSSFVLLEAKNWSSNVDRAEYDAFHMKVKERGGACRIGLFVAGAGFTSGFYTRATHHGSEGFSIVPLAVPRLAESLSKGSTVEEALAHRVEQVVLDRQWEE